MELRLLAAILLVSFTLHFPANGGSMAVQGGTIDVEYTGTVSPALEKTATKWIKTSAHALANYYGTFSVPRLTLRITLADGHDVSGGQSFGWQGALTTVSLGRDATNADLADDWILTHEMMHLAFPNILDRYLWLEEGLATYCEPIARCRVGIIPPERVWFDLVDRLPEGEPKSGDHGLDHTHTWGRTYWGGALFCLRADVEIRRRTNNRFGLEHALRAIHAAGGTIVSTWTIDRVIATGDAATGVPVLRELYDGMKDKPVTVDLPALWKQLGVVRHGTTVTFDNSAPLAAVRRAITEREAPRRFGTENGSASLQLPATAVPASCRRVLDERVAQQRRRFRRTEASAPYPARTHLRRGNRLEPFLASAPNQNQVSDWQAAGSARWSTGRR